MCHSVALTHMSGALPSTAWQPPGRSSQKQIGLLLNPWNQESCVSLPLAMFLFNPGKDIIDSFPNKGLLPLNYKSSQNKIQPALHFPNFLKC